MDIKPILELNNNNSDTDSEEEIFYDENKILSSGSYDKKYDKFYFKYMNDKVNNLTKEANNYPESIDILSPIIGETISIGNYGDINEIINDEKKILKQTKAIKRFIEIIKNKFHPATFYNYMNMYEDIKNEERNVLNYVKLKKIFPNNFIELHDIFKTRNSIYYQNNYIYEKIDGNTLKYAIENKIMNDKEVNLFFSQLIYIITYSNINKLFHNDIKSDNIMYKRVNNIIKYDNLLIDKYKCKLKIEMSDYFTPVLIDYDISKQTEKYNQYPVELINIIIILTTIKNNSLLEILTNFFDNKLLNELDICIFGDNMNTVKTQKYYDNIQVMKDEDKIKLINMFKEINKLIN
jgi:serine/threonine protein kinase